MKRNTGGPAGCSKKSSGNRFFTTQSILAIFGSSGCRGCRLLRGFRAVKVLGRVLGLGFCVAANEGVRNVDTEVLTTHNLEQLLATGSTLTSTQSPRTEHGSAPFLSARFGGLVRVQEHKPSQNSKTSFRLHRLYSLQNTGVERGDSVTVIAARVP